MSDTGILIIDIQGNLARQVADSDNVITTTAKLIRVAQTLASPIVWIEQYPQGLGSTVPELADLLSAQQAVAKTTFNACNNASVMQAITNANCNHWAVAGIEAHICVYQTVKTLLQQRYRVSVIEDAVSSRNPHHKHLAMDNLRQMGAEISVLEMFAYEQIGDASDPVFKTLLPLFK